MHSLMSLVGCIGLAYVLARGILCVLYDLCGVALALLQ